MYCFLQIPHVFQDSIWWLTVLFMKLPNHTDSLSTMYTYKKKEWSCILEHLKREMYEYYLPTVHLFSLAPSFNLVIVNKIYNVICLGRMLEGYSECHTVGIFPYLGFRYNPQQLISIFVFLNAYNSVYSSFHWSISTDNKKILKQHDTKHSAG